MHRRSFPSTVSGAQKNAAQQDYSNLEYGEDEDDDDSDEEQAQIKRPVGGFPRILRYGITTFTVSDLFVLYVLLSTWPQSCDASSRLKVWLFGSLLLSWPASFVVARIFHESGSFHQSFAVELLFHMCAFAWLAWGSAVCWLSEDCMEQAPLLFWSIFTLTLLVWSAIITILCLLLLSTVLTVLASAKG
eukprot:TRINITY_DN35679_c0_g1_i1.p1 TRINITY_DN35679_c0_g1~~TRINITY_DN35679_c0_g1_i1.p1  ORF type:complete len:189 (-),score=20.42 TRINITY_DN35679_c0_g1_i1:797-1363(-)